MGFSASGSHCVGLCAPTERRSSVVGVSRSRRSPRDGMPIVCSVSSQISRRVVVAFLLIQFSPDYIQNYRDTFLTSTGRFHRPPLHSFSLAKSRIAPGRPRKHPDDTFDGQQQRPARRRKAGCSPNLRA